MEALVTSIQDDNLLLAEINKYINQDHISPLVEAGYLASQNNPNIGDHGQLLHAVISWNPHNLVAGPLPPNTPMAALANPPASAPTATASVPSGPPYHRSQNDDPKNSVDTNINNMQTPNYQAQVANVSTLQDFGNLPDSQPVNWEVDPTDPGKLKVAP